MQEQEIKDAIKRYEGSKEYHDLMLYNSYYNVDNHELYKKWKDRQDRRVSPNWAVPTPYYATVIDTMSGFMMSDIEYESSNQKQNDRIKELLDSNLGDVKDMKTGTYALAFNRAYELVYQDAIKGLCFSCINPLQIIPIYDNAIEPQLETAIWKRKNCDGTVYIDVISANLWQKFKVYKDERKLKDHDYDYDLIELEEPKELYFKECPVVEYRTELIGDKSSFDQVINYVIALDWAISGNSNEIDRLADAILALGTAIDKSTIKNLDEIKTIENLSKDDLIPQYIEKNSSPEFRKYVSDLLINEIHKHSHVIDWYNVALAGGDTSAKALKIRLFDMQMYSNRLEKVYREGIYKRLRLMGFLDSAINGTSLNDINVKFNRTLPDEVIDMITNLKGVDFISEKTKQSLCGLDPKVEAQNMAEENKEYTDLSDNEEE